MLHHYRKTIREELKRRVTNLPGQVGAPLDSIDDVTDQSEVPLACVFFTEEPVALRRTSSGDHCKFTRTLSASIVIVAKRQDDLDLLAAEVERRMVPSLEKGVEALYDGVLFQSPKRGEFEFHAISLNYKISYSTDEGSPERLSA